MTGAAHPHRLTAVIVTVTLGLMGITGCAAPPVSPPLPPEKRATACRPPAAITAGMTALINRARASARRCGTRTFPAAPPVRRQPTLTDAAWRHSAYMAAANRLDHHGRGGSTVADRVRQAGYRWRAVGENVAGGVQTTAAAVAGWLDSPGHCANLMEAEFTEVGAACAVNPDSRYKTYWTLVLAAPLKE
jgi:uncharacterized protein YkwD